MFKLFLLLVYVSLSFNYLTPDKYDAVLLEENEIKCHIGKIRYKINNYHAKQYLLFTKEYMISEFDLYVGNTRITYETNSDNNYFFRIQGNTILYLVVNINTKYSYCISFKFIDSIPIILKNNEEFLYPVLNSPAKINMKINDVANKHFIFNISNIDSAYTFYVSIEGENTHYFATRKELTSMIIQDNEINVYVSISGPVNVMVASFKYLSVPYSNITGDIFNCIDSPQSIQSFFLNSKSLKNKGFCISSTNNNIDIYENGNLKTELNYYDFNSYSLSSPYSYILQRDKGCFQLLASCNRIENEQSIKILNSEMIPIKISLVDCKYIIFSIYSSENNFIEQFKLKDKLQDLEIKKKDDKYYYNFEFEREYGPYINIKFNLNSKDYITVNFEIEYKHSLAWLYILLVCVGSFAFIIIIYKKDAISEIFEKICEKCPHRKKIKENYIKKEKELREIERKKQLIKKKENEERLLERQKDLENISNFYNIIKVNYNYINHVCLKCAKKDYVNKEFYYDANDKIDIIDEINKGKFDNFMQYIKPEKCSHYSHKFCKNYNNECILCDLFMTTKNMKKFGLFFSENDFKQIYEKDVRDLNDLKKKIIKNIENIFYSEIERTTWGINKTKKENLLRLRKINQKYIDNYNIVRKCHNNNYFAFYEISINNDLDLDELEKNLEYEIQTEKEIKEEQERRKRERYEEKERKYEENRRNNEPIKLKRCSQCREVCPLCNGDINKKYPGINHYRISRGYNYFAHYKCIKDKKSCFICHYNEGLYDCQRCCDYCHETKKFPDNYCYYCKKYLK